ncbi:MAG: SemiSWEET transporter [Defluviitaleaceae bacterium]|nr:SemiSWEET transporter [Defluviitaleaceae bacterium]
MAINILGYVAAFLTTVAFVPQVYKALKTKNTADISLYMYICFIAGLTAWMIYGIFEKVPAIILANSVTLSLAAVILTYKIIHVIKGEKP